MGAVFLTALKVELYRIQLLARWQSPVIMHYARLAPLKSLTDQVKDVQSAMSLGKLMAEVQGSIEELTRKYAHLEANVLAELKGDILATQRAATPAADRGFVRNDKTKCHHKVLVKTGHPLSWTSQCSWTFAFVPHSFVDCYPDDVRALCDKCFFHERLRLKALGPA